MRKIQQNKHFSKIRYYYGVEIYFLFMNNNDNDIIINH